VLGLVALKRLRPHWPRMLIVVAGASVVAWALGIEVATIGSPSAASPPVCRPRRCRR
jgi:sulfate permease, SulP family